MHSMTVLVLLGVVLPNTMTAGHWSYLVSAPQHTHGGSAPPDHDHSGHNQTPGPSAPQLEQVEDTLAASLDGASLWEVLGEDPFLTVGDGSAPPSPPPRSL